MPQMAPISWMELLIIFSITLMIFNNMNFFIYKKKSILEKTKFKKLNSKWKW
uniref:ATP synthase complex subunit 8 n=1 Tax=Heterocerus parallelus TaxID=1587350 RepID=A0A343C1I0_9COLE|nr:ATP synthase F0 subunit 8 [Heterocerus parallelus]